MDTKLKVIVCRTVLFDAYTVPCAEFQLRYEKFLPGPGDKMFSRYIEEDAAKQLFGKPSLF